MMKREDLKRLFPMITEDVLARSAEKAPIVDRSDTSKMEELQQMVTAGIRPTTNEQNLNQLEKRYLFWLHTSGDLWIGVQCITLKLGHDCRYTPDFWALDLHGLRAMDTKGGHVWEDSLIKMRVAARLFRFVRFLRVEEDGEIWKHTEVKP